ncbi:glycosyltransferase family 2 protein [Intestinimonas butyriciproducens]|nr:glycosyltransferase family 2 protein [Intestinimonas butyriciproducens]SCJ25497.1 Chondroitin polymerase [uncultured Clostridium sp.]
MNLTTVFTPTYNRAYLLPRLYQSLKAQTVTNFEWLIVDDGSTDDTQQVIQRWAEQENKFSIRYTRVENGGKHRAINLGVQLARGELFFIVDSDDALAPNAMERINFWRNSIRGSSEFAGVSGTCITFDGKAVGTTISGEFVDATVLQWGELGISGDKAEVYYTDVLKRYPFPEISGETFLTEAVVWNRIGNDGLKLRYFNEQIYLCEYIQDGLTMQGREIFRKNPEGYALFVRESMRFFGHGWRKKLYDLFYFYQDIKGDNGPITAAEKLRLPLWTALFIPYQTFKMTAKKLLNH